MIASASITRRLMLSILSLEFLAAVILVALVTNHERRVRFEALDANLRATSNALLGAVQEVDERGAVGLDLREVQLPAHAILRVTADEQKLLGSQGMLPGVRFLPNTVTRASIGKHTFRFYTLKGMRSIDPGTPDAVQHQVLVIYGLSEGRTWHEIFEATRFFAFATAILLGMTALFMLWLIRRSLLPIRELAREAEKVNAEHWSFQAPESSKRFTELRPLSSAIDTALSRLQRSFEQQRQFTNDAAHELKTDLAIIKSSFQLLNMRRRTVEEYQQGLILGLEDIGRLEGTVQKLLTLVRLEQSPHDGLQIIDFSSAVEAAVAQIRPYADLRQITTLVVELQPDLPVAMNMDDALLLCSNILVNAIQHSPVSGTVELSLLSYADKVVLEVRDHGEGIVEQDRPFLFDAFYRGDASRSRKSGGTGLGLSICKAICERTSGKISIANHALGGAFVQVTLPQQP